MGGSPAPKKEIKSLNFTDLTFKIRYSTLKFDPKEGKFLLIMNEDPMSKQKSTTKDELERLSEEEKSLKEEIDKKTKLIENQKKKLEELKEKEEIVMKILKIDINEKDHFDQLYQKFKESKSNN